MDSNSINSVPLGQAGTGAAYILGDSQAINNTNDFAEALANKRLQNALLKKKQAADLAKAWQQNQLDIKGGTLFQPEINKRAQQVMQMGMDLQRAGVNPGEVNAPDGLQGMLDTYNQQRRQLLSDVDLRDQIQNQAKEHEKLISAQPAGYFDPQSIQDYHDFVSGKLPLSHISSNGLQMPELKKNFDLQDKIGKMEGTHIETKSIDPHTGVQRRLVLPDESANMNKASTLVSNDPEVQADIAKKAGIPYSQIGDETDPTVLKKQLDAMWRSGGNEQALVKQGINSYNDPAYDQMLNTQAAQMAQAAKVKHGYVGGIAQFLNDKVNKANEKDYNFKYQEEMRQRQRMGMDTQKFDQWLKDQQSEDGSYFVGNQNSMVPVRKMWTDDYKNHIDDNGKQLYPNPQPERGASLFGVNLPSVKTVVRPTEVTDTRSGKTIKNTNPFEVQVSQIQMVPVFKGLDGNDPRNGSEISARQLKEMITGKSKVGGLGNIAYQPFAYGIKQEKDKNNIHTIQTPVKFSYDALKGSNTKKINTSTFDNATEELKGLQGNPKFQQLSPADKLEFIKQRYNLNLEQ